FRRLPRGAAGIYFRGEIRFSLSGPGAIMAKSVAWDPHIRPRSRGVRLFHREPRPNREHRAGPAIALSNFTRTLPRHDRPSLVRSLDAAAVSGTRVRRVQPFPVLC